MPVPHVCLIHRNRLLSECLAAALTDTCGCRCSIITSNTFDEESATSFGDTAIDLLLLDATLDFDRSLHVSEQAKSLHPSCKIVLLVAEHAVDRMVELAQIAIHGCLYEGTGLGDFRTAIKSILAGQAFCSPHLATALLAQVGRTDPGKGQFRQSDLAQLTTREREVLDLIANQQLGNKQIARQLGLSLYTVKNHVHNIIEKLGVADRHEAVQFARRRRRPSAERTDGVEVGAVRFPR